ncbi:MAG: hypothetical protein IH946_02430 [Bacteroidetes bacterium]|nr:hypothetical protein [Bacteroidota bacterium]
MKIHREGRQSILAYLLFSVIVNFCVLYFFRGNTIIEWSVIALSVIMFILILNFFRDPKREAYINDQHVVAPADGKVVVIEEVEEGE